MNREKTGLGSFLTLPKTKGFPRLKIQIKTKKASYETVVVRWPSGSCVGVAATGREFELPWRTFSELLNRKEEDIHGPAQVAAAAGARLRNAL